MPTKPEDSISQTVFWPLYIAGRFALSMIFFSVFALVVALGCHEADIQFELDGIKQSVSPTYMLEINRRTAAESASPWLSAQMAKAFYTCYFEWTGVHSIVLKQRDQGVSEGFFTRTVARHPDAIAVAMLAMQLFGLRVGNAILSIPLIALVVILAAVDGLAERSIRRECGGYESAGRYYLARRFAFSLLPPAVALVYLCLPIDIALSSVLLPLLAVTAVLIRMKMQYYKKYF